MPKTFNVCTNLVNEAGLEQDYKLIRALLESQGHTVNGCQFNDYTCSIPSADITICLEVVNPRFFSKENWLVPNSEWWFPSFNGTLRHFSKVLCKTQDAVSIWSKKLGAPKDVRYVGWEARDLRIEGAPWAGSRFLHAAGRSETKNTELVAAAWRTGKIDAPLTILSASWRLAPLLRGIPNCTVIQRASDEELRLMMNHHPFHIMPSAYEGYGHSIHEALGCGGIVITMDAPPMNQIYGVERHLLIPSVKQQKRLEAICHTPAVEGIVEAANKALLMEWEYRCDVATHARQFFLSERAAFRRKFLEIANA
jgi:hypothetical protein